MSKKSFKSQASSSRAFSGHALAGFGGYGGSPPSSASASFGGASSVLSYLGEPPDLGAISNVNVVVNFKNLSKRDTVTKSRALEELHAYITSQIADSAEVEDALIDAWIRIYPRLSVDGSRRVRQLSHTLLGRIAAVIGKRIAKQMPKVIGPWLAGLHDGDTIVVRSAQESFALVFPTPEKREALSRIYQQPILEYCSGVILEETAQTLSDPRTTTVEDSEAKYARVIASHVLEIRNLLENLADDIVAKEEKAYESLLQNERTWEFISAADPAVRRAIMKLLQTCLHKRRDLIVTNRRAIARALLSKRALSHQLGSAYDFSETLATISDQWPAIWLDDVADGLLPLDRLQRLLRSGSQGGPPNYWVNIAHTVNKMPDSVLAGQLDHAVKTLQSMQSGITRKEEPRANNAIAWQCYFVLARRLSSLLSSQDQEQLIRQTCLPVILEYITPQDPSWIISHPKRIDVISDALQDKRFQLVAESEWPRLGIIVLESVQTSSPAQAENFDSNQNAVAVQSARWYDLLAKLLQTDITTSFREIILETSRNLLRGSIDVVVARQGMPHGAAETIHIALRDIGSTMLRQTALRDAFEVFLSLDLPKLLLSPSGPKLVNVLYDADTNPKFEEAWISSLHNILQSSDDLTIVLPALRNLLGSSKLASHASIAAKDVRLQHYYAQNVTRAIEGAEAWSLFEKPIRVDLVLATSSIDDMLSAMTEALTIAPNMPYVLAGLEVLVDNNTALLRNFLASRSGSNMIQHLLLLADSEPEEIAEKATYLAQSMQSVLFETGEGSRSTNSILEIIQTGLKEAHSKSLPVDTLAELGLRVYAKQDAQTGRHLLQVLPDRDEWQKNIRNACEDAPSQTLAISGPVGGAVYLCAAARDSSISNISSYEYDINGYSPIVRMAQYSIRVFTETRGIASLGDEHASQYYHLLALTTQMIKDKLTANKTNSLWTDGNISAEDDMLELTSTALSFLKSCESRETATTGKADVTASNYVILARDQMMSDTTDFSGFSFYNSQACCASIIEAIEIHGWHQNEQESPEHRLRELRKNTKSFSLVTLLAAYKIPLSHSQILTRFINELVSDLTAEKAGEIMQQGLYKLACMNIILQDQEELASTISKQRVIFFAKHTIQWLTNGEVSAAVKAESCKVLTVVLPHMQDIYGTHWADILEFLVQLWSSQSYLNQATVWSARLSLIHASLKLCESMRTMMFMEDSNDDLKDSWSESKDGLGRGLINILRQSGQIQDDTNQALQSVNQLLARQISRMPSGATGDDIELYPLLGVESPPVQATAFGLLHKRIPKQQEQLSLDIALDKSVARYPEELLSLILQAPQIDPASKLNIHRLMPSSIRGFLSSWLLVFDHFKNASDKVKSDYISHLKEDDYLDQLLGFMFEFLGHASGKPVDVSKFEPTTYSFDIQESPFRDLQWLLTHLYYLCLTRLPSATKAWWFGCKSRQTVVNVESWTEKYISPAVITDALSTVEQWADTQITATDDDLLIKINHRSKEVMISKEIDDQHLSMVIRLPANFPLGQAVVEGVNRVAVDEKKWRSWLLNAQGVITFSNNSLTDGIIAFRRNVEGALKGQTECAICYSIISADKQLPTKRCGTCKNLFHGSCLFKWFKSSNSSSCPLCRNPFNYT